MAFKFNPFTGNFDTILNPIFKTTSSSGTFNAVANTTHIVDTSGAGAAVTLPSSPSNTFIRIKDNGNANTNNIVVTPAAGTVDGAASHTIDSDYASVVYVFDGSNWHIL